MCCELDSMSELSGFVYIKSQVTLHVKSKAQKVYWNLILAYWMQKLLNCSYKRFHNSPIHTYVVQECCWIANSVVKVVMNGFCIIMFVCCLHCVQDGVTDSKVSGNESIFFLWYDDWRIRMSKIVMECWLKCKNRSWTWSFFVANECNFTQ